MHKKPAWIWCQYCSVAHRLNESCQICSGKTGYELAKVVAERLRSDRVTHEAIPKILARKFSFKDREINYAMHQIKRR